MFSIWIIISLGVCCNIPYFLAQHLIGKVVKYRAGIPLAGGNFVTRLANSYNVFILRVTHTRTCIKSNDLTLIFFGINECCHCNIPGDEEVEPFTQPEEQPRQRGHQNVKRRGDRVQPQNRFMMYPLVV